MTDLVGNILTQMSSAFNQVRPKTEEIGIKLTEDKTLKWRGLHNNQFAASRKRGKQIKSENGEMIEDNSISGMCSSSGIGGCGDIDEETIEGGGGANSSEFNSNEKLNKIIEKEEVACNTENIITNVADIAATEDNFASSANAAKTQGNLENILDSKCNEIKKQENGFDSSSTEKKLKNRTKLQVDKSERVLRRKALNENSESNETLQLSSTSSSSSSPNKKEKTKEILTDESNKKSPAKKPKKQSEDLATAVPSTPTATIDNAQVESSPNKKRGRKKDNSIERVSNKIESSSSSSPPKKDNLEVSLIPIKSEEIETISTITTIIPLSVIKTPKKRGRKPKIQINEIKKDPIKIEIQKSPTKKSQRVSKDGGTVLATAIARKEKINEQIVPQQRLSRRIKPTAKILASEELRFGFVLQNNARISFGNDPIESLPSIEIPEKKKNRSVTPSPPNKSFKKTSPPPQPPALPPSSSSPSTSSSSSSLSSTSQEHNQQIPPDKIKTESKSDTNDETTQATTTTTPRKSCPDPVAFLQEIKNQKIALNRSPEDKKLNKKQHRRLLKSKEKHLALLGLKKATKSTTENITDSDDISDDVDEFLPSRKVQVGKPGVTLRHRNQKHDEIIRAHQHHQQQNHHQHHHHHHHQQTRKRKLISHPKSTKLSNEILIKNKINESSSPTSLSVASSLHNFLCLCDKKSQYYVRKSQELMQCVAIDQIDGHHIGCSNEVIGELLNLTRPSSRVSYMILCESHRKRLAAHNCCAGCGVFCSQGKFAICPHNHLFHRDCSTKLIVTAPFDPTNMDNFTGPILSMKCPHCGLDASKEDFLITLKCRDSFVLLPHQLKRAKMVFPSDHAKSSQSSSMHRLKNTMINVDKLIPEHIFDILLKSEKQLTHSPLVKFTTKDLFYAINNDNILRVSEIISSGFDITTSFREFQNGTCLHLVSSHGSPTMAYLILCKAITRNFLDLMDNELRTALMCAVAAEKYEILKILIRCGADVTIRGTDGMTVLHLAAKRGDFMSIKLILDYCWQCWNVAKFKLLVDSVDDGNWTALVWAAENGYSDIVSYLISLGADASICDNENNTALHWAALSDRIDTVIPLLQSSCDFNIQNVNGDTPLHISCRQSNTQICLVFLAHGSDLNIKNILNETPYDSIPDENSQCARAIRFNIQLRQSVGYPKRKILSQDISNGRERYPIQIIINNYNSNNHNIDCDDTIDLPDFKYITKAILLQNALQIDQRISQMRICSCTDDCTTEDCQCSVISLQNWYNAEGCLKDDFNYDDPAMIFECNDVCGCNKMLCKNRVVQNGIKCRLQVFECFETAKGWGVQTLTKINRGTFIAEYTGEILTDAEADRRTDDSYFFDLGSVDHCIDANFYGNVSRFFNHSCHPNVVPVRVYFEHQDLRFPKIAFFANRDIEPLEEITFDYGEKFWIVKFKSFTCHCNTIECKYSKNTISKTLEEYNQRNSNCAD